MSISAFVKVRCERISSLYRWKWRSFWVLGYLPNSEVHLELCNTGVLLDELQRSVYQGVYRYLINDHLVLVKASRNQVVVLHNGYSSPKASCEFFLQLLSLHHNF